MKQSAVESLEQSGIGAALVAMTTRDGSATHRYVTGPLLSSDANAARNLADAANRWRANGSHKRPMASPANARF